MPAEIPTLTREAAWRRYQDQLGTLTSREESMIQRAFFAGWEARDRQLQEIIERVAARFEKPAAG